MQQQLEKSLVTPSFQVDPAFLFKPHPFAMYSKTNNGYASSEQSYEVNEFGRKHFLANYYGENLYIAHENPLLYEFNMLLLRENINLPDLNNPFDVAYQQGLYKEWIMGLIKSRDQSILNALAELKSAYYQVNAPYQVDAPYDEPLWIIQLDNQYATLAQIIVPILDEFVRKSLDQLQKRRADNQIANTIQGLFQYRLISQSGNYVLLDLEPGQTMIEIQGKNGQPIQLAVYDILNGNTFMTLQRFSGVTDIEGNPLFEGDQVQTLQSESSFGPSTAFVRFNSADQQFYLFREMDEGVRLEPDMLIVKK
ncbi:hypothetical protein ABD91_21475 [Lysinibacillus sphaericus]|uniref:hypothetical protein n=1 Tax=Lysinibacillus sphaericus TaxID=1421 RepID=UPI0018CD2AA1|nr:hypothetical protein [Lysinibacillus sphaericus]MBG9693309.1 hypothetical protein [Lysinibacillus sphaericus]